MAIGVSTRNYERSLGTLPDSLATSGTSKNAVSRRFVAMTEAQLQTWLEKDLSELGIVALMLDGIVIDKRSVIVALGIDENGKKHVLGLFQGNTENATICGELLDQLIARGLDPLSAYLFVIDGRKALSSAIWTRFGSLALIQRCQVHKKRNVLSHLPKELHATVNKALSDAYKAPTAKAAQTRVTALAKQLLDEHPDAAGSLKEGLSELFTVKALALPKALEKALSTTNVIENSKGGIRNYVRRVKHWQNGSMIKRWVGAALVEKERGFHRLKGKSGMPLIVAALQERTAQHHPVDRQQEAA